MVKQLHSESWLRSLKRSNPKGERVILRGRSTSAFRLRKKRDSFRLKRRLDETAGPLQQHLPLSYLDNYYSNGGKRSLPSAYSYEKRGSFRLKKALPDEEGEDEQFQNESTALQEKRGSFRLKKMVQYPQPDVDYGVLSKRAAFRLKRILEHYENAPGTPAGISS